MNRKQINISDDTFREERERRERRQTYIQTDTLGSEKLWAQMITAVIRCTHLR